MTERQRRRRKQLSNDLREAREYWKQKQEALDRAEFALEEAINIYKYFQKTVVYVRVFYKLTNMALQTGVMKINVIRVCVSLL